MAGHRRTPNARLSHHDSQEPAEIRKGGKKRRKEWAGITTGPLRFGLFLAGAEGGREKGKKKLLRQSQAILELKGATTDFPPVGLRVTEERRGGGKREKRLRSDPRKCP